LTVPLATTGLAAVNGSPLAAGTQGAIGSPTTVVLIGNSELDYGTFSGGRFSTGFWFDPRHQCCGIEGRFFALDEQSMGASANSDANGLGFVGVPFQSFQSLVQQTLDANVNPELAMPVGASGILGGGITMLSNSSLYSAEINLLAVLYRSCDCRLTFICGGRHTRLDEQIDVIYKSTALVNGALTFPLNGVGQIPNTNTSALRAGDSIVMQDGFSTRNLFNGGQFGVRLESCWGRCWVELEGKVALGHNEEQLSIAGLTTATTQGAGGRPIPNTIPSGFLANTSNAGVFTRNEFGVIVDLEAKIGVNICYGLSGFLGYDFMVWNRVARPGENISRIVDLTQVPRSPAPIPLGTPGAPSYEHGYRGSPVVVPVADDVFWARGVTMGLELRY
jgi:hypothetical protein